MMATSVLLLSLFLLSIKTKLFRTYGKYEGIYVILHDSKYD